MTKFFQLTLLHNR